MARTYSLTESSVRSINRTIRTVNQIRKKLPDGELPFRPNQRTPVGTPTLKIGKTTAEWAKLEEATLEVWKRNSDGDMEAVAKDDGTAVTFTAYNLFATIEADKFVACLNGFLISAECGG